jgi:tetratricopeptide (TPR) repeat protein
MNARNGFAFLASLALIAGGCASGGSAGGGGAAPAGEPIVVGGRTLAEGIAPRDNASTQTAMLFLSQAQATDDPAAAEQRFQEALTAALQGIETDPENPQSWFQAGQAHIGLGDYVAADSTLARAEELHPLYYLEIAPIREQAWVEKFNEAIEFSNNREYPQAIEVLEEAHLIYRERPEAMMNLGNLYAVNDQPNEAVAIYQEALELMGGPMAAEQDPETQASWEESTIMAETNVAMLLAQVGRNEEAVQAYETILQRDPSNVTAASSLGALLSSMGRDAEAQEIFNALSARTDLDAEDFMFAGIGLFQAEDYVGAARSFQRSVELNPHSRDAYFNLSQATYLAADGAAEGDPVKDEMWQALAEAGERLIALDPQNENAFRLYAQGLVRTGRDQQAVPLLERMEGLQYEVLNTQFQPVADGGAMVRGEIHNRSLAAGTPVRLRFVFSSATGQELGSQEVQVQAGAAEQAVPFEVEFQSTSAVNGFRYEVVGG